MEIAVSQRAVKGFEQGRLVSGHGWADAEERRHCWIMYMLCRWALNWGEMDNSKGLDGWIMLTLYGCHERQACMGISQRRRILTIER